MLISKRVARGYWVTLRYIQMRPQPILDCGLLVSSAFAGHKLAFVIFIYKFFIHDHAALAWDWHITFAKALDLRDRLHTVAAKYFGACGDSCPVSTDDSGRFIVHNNSFPKVRISRRITGRI